jgi:hypothetical protein
VTATSYIFGIVSAALALFVVIELLRRRQLRERHAIWWLIAGTLALIVGIFPATLEWAASLIGIAVLFLVCLQHSAELTRLEAKTRTLAEEAALQDVRIRDLEERVRQAGTTPTDD